MTQLTSSTTAAIAPTFDIDHVAFIDTDASRGVAWKGVDGYDYQARIFEDEETGPYCRVVCFGTPEAPGERCQWRLAANTYLLRLIIDGAWSERFYWVCDELADIGPHGVPA